MGLFATLLGLANSAPVRAEAPAVRGVLVLYNGNVLSGAVRRFGDEYEVDQGGTTMRVPADRVERFAATIEEAYDARRASQTGTSADAHLELAQWCLRQNLCDQAAREILDARTLDPKNPQLAAVELQLRHLLEARDAPAEPKRNDTTTADDPVGEAPTPPREISPAAQVQFVRSIQPMLIHSCALAGCHQAGSTHKLQIDHWALAGNGNAEKVRRNLTSVLRELDVDDPPASDLMRWARTAHGRRESGLPSRPLAAHQATILLAWLNEAAGKEPVSPIPLAADAPDKDGDALPGDDGDAAAALPPAGQAVGGAVPATRATEGFAPGQMPIPRAYSRRLPQHDPFDADVFNRRNARKAAEQARRELAAESKSEKHATDAGPGADEPGTPLGVSGASQAPEEP